MTASTKLEAINVMLSTIHEAPVNSISGAVPNEVAIAVTTLDETSREVQSRGWHFNTERDYDMTPNVDGFLKPPANALTADLERSTHYNMEVTQRGDKFYDKKNHTSVFETGKVYKAHLILFLEWEQLPEPARRYILLKAARRFQSRTIGSQELYGFTQMDENQASGDLLRYELKMGDYNTIHRNPVNYRKLRRRPY